MVGQLTNVHEERFPATAGVRASVMTRASLAAFMRYEIVPLQRGTDRSLGLSSVVDCKVIAGGVHQVVGSVLDRGTNGLLGLTAHIHLSELLACGNISNASSGGETSLADLALLSSQSSVLSSKSGEYLRQS